MALLHRSHTSGFTLLELLVVFGLLTLVLAIALPVGLDTLSRTYHKSTHETVVAALETARSEALADSDSGPVEACQNGSEILVLSGMQFASSTIPDARYPLDVAAIVSSTNSFFLCSMGGVVFTPLSATTSTTGTLWIADPHSATSSISITSEGGILESP